MTALRRDLAASVILLIVAVCYYAAASRLGSTALSDEVGPAGLPRVYAVALGAIGLVIGATALLRNRLRNAAADVATPDALRRLARGAGAVAIGIVYLAVVDLIGYPFAMAAMLAAMAVYQGESVSLRLLLGAAIGAAVLFVFFEFVLGVRLPAPWNA